MFKLLRCEDLSGNVGETDILLIPEGEVDVFPEVKYLYNEEDPTDKRRWLRFGKYFETRLNCRFVGSYGMFKQLYTFINNSVLVNDLDIGLGLYLWFEEANGTVHGYPIFGIEEQPEAMHDGRFFNAEYEFVLRSIYIATPHLPVFLNYGNGNYGAGNYGY
jgi:hypothetical protein